ncbi:MAG: efflux RND transporter periplasmic adaptor subunit [Acidobacteriota bacterium]
MAQKTQGLNRGWVWAIAAVVAAFVVYFVYNSTRPTVAVTAVKVTRSDIVSTVPTNGVVVLTREFQAHAAAPGVVDQLFVKVGDMVSAGQRLVEMDASDARNRVATARATLQGAELGLKNMEGGGSQDEQLADRNNIAAAQSDEQQAATSLAALQKLQAQGAASANEVAAAQQKLSQAQMRLSQLQSHRTQRYGSGDLASQRAMVAQAQAGLAAAETAYADVDIRAPFAGTVYTIPVTRYDFVQDGALLLAVADLTKLQVKAYFDEPEIGKLQAGQPVTIAWAAKPGLAWHGHILKAPTTVTTYGTRNVGECLITVDDARGDLLPNTNVTVTVTTQKRTDVLSLPREALHTQGTNDYVFRIINGALVKTPVVTGVVNLVQFEIVSGLKEGDVVALHSTDGAELKDGVRATAQFQ